MNRSSQIPEQAEGAALLDCFHWPQKDGSRFNKKTKNIRKQENVAVVVVVVDDDNDDDDDGYGVDDDDDYAGSPTG